MYALNIRPSLADHSSCHPDQLPSRPSWTQPNTFAFYSSKYSIMQTIRSGMFATYLWSGVRFTEQAVECLVLDPERAYVRPVQLEIGRMNMKLIDLMQPCDVDVLTVPKALTRRCTPGRHRFSGSSARWSSLLYAAFSEIAQNRLHKVLDWIPCRPNADFLLHFVSFLRLSGLRSPHRAPGAALRLQRVYHCYVEVLLLHAGSRAFQPVMARRQAPAARRCECEAVMQFIKGIDEPCVPDIKLTRSKDGSNGVGTPCSVTGWSEHHARHSICLCLPHVQFAASRTINHDAYQLRENLTHTASAKQII